MKEDDINYSILKTYNLKCLEMIHPLHNDKL
jgi:hypothetical protein